MKTLLFLVLLAGLSAADAAQRVAFERDDGVWIANADGSGERKLIAGIFPSISADGTRIAYTTVEKSGTTYIRHIATVAVDTGEVKVFTGVPSDNVYYASWSPDGKRILFTLRRDEVWDLASVASDGTDFQTIKKGEPNAVTFYSPGWAADAQSVFCEDMTNIYRVGIDGKEISRWKIEDLVPHAGMSGDCRLDASADGKRLLLSIEMGEEHHRKDWDGPQPALWRLDLASGKAVRVTPKPMFAWDGCWIDSENVLFLNQPTGEKEPSIYRIGVDGKKSKLLIKHARFPSISAP